MKQNNYDAAIDILSSGARLLLEAGQGGSGGDLGMFLLEIYNKAELTPDSASKARLLSLLRAFPVGELTRKRFVNEMISYVHCLNQINMIFAAKRIQMVSQIWRVSSW